MMDARSLRMIALVVPAVVAAAVAYDPARVVAVTAPMLGAPWLVMFGVLAVRFLQARRRAAPGAPTCWDQVDVLTASGAATIWSSAGALFAASLTGWASLSVLGVLGGCTVCVTVTWSAIVAGGDRPWRRAAISRRVLPELATEDDPLREELHLAGVHIPAGMRLFATGQAMRHGALARYAIGSEASGASVTLHSELGGARRGEHTAPPLALWLGDLLGLTRTASVARGPARFTVLPRVEPVDGARALLGDAGDAAIARPAHLLPTEGTFRIRDYAAGDDARRIHWVRSLQHDRLVVRLPDEIPLGEPAVRLILDTALRGTELLTCRAPDELLDALVRVWLGIARVLADAGARVTLVAAVERGGRVGPVARTLAPRALRDGLQLGARVAWQPTHPLDELLAAAPARQIVVSSRPRRLAAASEAAWVVVPEAAWTPAELPALGRSGLTLAFPSGSAENRGTRRRRERRRIEQMWQDRALFSQVICWTDLSTFAGDYVARPRAGRVALAVIA
jgi:uncharacterized protein (DUF58 family)